MLINAIETNDLQRPGAIKHLKLSFFTYNFVRFCTMPGLAWRNILCMNPLTTYSNNQFHRGQTDQ
jgi:hypothetical protein